VELARGKYRGLNDHHLSEKLVEVDGIKACLEKNQLLRGVEQALCFKQQRTVAKDNTVAFKGAVFQIPKKSPYRSYANKRIDVHVLLDGAVEFFLPKTKNRTVRFQNDARI